MRTESFRRQTLEQDDGLAEQARQCHGPGHGDGNFENTLQTQCQTLTDS